MSEKIVTLNEEVIKRQIRELVRGRVEETLNELLEAEKLTQAAREKVKAVIAELRDAKLRKAAKKVQDGVEETLTYYGFSYEHWSRI